MLTGQNRLVKLIRNRHAATKEIPYQVSVGYSSLHNNNIRSVSVCFENSEESISFWLTPDEVDRLVEQLRSRKILCQ